MAEPIKFTELTNAGELSLSAIMAIVQQQAGELVSLQCSMAQVAELVASGATYQELTTEQKTLISAINEIAAGGGGGGGAYFFAEGQATAAQIRERYNSGLMCFLIANDDTIYPLTAVDAEYIQGERVEGVFFAKAFGYGDNISVNVKYIQNDAGVEVSSVGFTGIANSRITNDMSATNGKIPTDDAVRAYVTEYIRTRLAQKLDLDLNNISAAGEQKIRDIAGSGGGGDVTKAYVDEQNALQDAEITKNKDSLTELETYTGMIYSLTPVKGKTIGANVGGRVNFSDNANRMYYRFKPIHDFDLTNITTRVAVIKATEGAEYDTCVSNSQWMGNGTPMSYHAETDGSFVFYILCDFINETITPIISSDGFVKDSLEILNENDIKHDNEISSLKMKNLANQYGFNSVLSLEWENGSINSSNGSNVDSSLNVIRTKTPIHFDDDVQIIVISSAFRVKPYKYSNDGSSFVGSDDWHNGKCNDTYTINKNYTYRFQIATNDGSPIIDKNKALSETLLCNANDVISGRLPAYWSKYLEAKVKTINTYMGNGVNKSAFLFLTDTHWNDGNNLNNRSINVNAMKYIKEKCNINYLIHGGDLNAEHRTDRNIARLFMTEPMSMMRNAFDNVFVTRGNHDDNIEGDGNNWNYVITQSDSYSYMFRNTKDVVFGKTGTYFYHDIPFEKVRYISLDCVDMVYSNSVDPSKCDQKILAYGREQLQWLCDVLKNTPNGYSIIIYTHAMLAPSNVTIDHPTEAVQTRAKNYLVVCDLLKAFKNRQNYSFDMTGYFTTVHQNYYDGVINGDFRDCNSTIVGVFSGHEHVDCIEDILDSNGVSIGIKNTCTQNSSEPFGSSVISHSYQAPMTIDSVTELVWDLVVVDRNNKKVTMIRIGAGFNDIREFNFS